MISGQVALELIMDFLEFFKMDYTSSVFTHESNLKDASKRDDLQRKLGLRSENNKPVLFQLINALTQQSSTDKENQYLPYWDFHEIISNRSIASTKPNTATSAAASKNFGADVQEGPKTSFDNFGRNKKEEAPQDKGDQGRTGGIIKIIFIRSFLIGK